MELGEIAEILQAKNVVKDFSNPYVVSNMPLAGLDIEQKLWIPKEDWPDAFPEKFRVTSGSVAVGGSYEASPVKPPLS